MLRVMLIDDEQGVIEGLKRLIDWNAADAEICGTFTDSKEAVKACAAASPELIITDIEMPGLSGLKLISELKKLVPGAVFAILSAYDYFSYAQEAINLSVFRYLLKPLSPEDLLKLINDAREAISDRETALSAAFGSKTAFVQSARAGQRADVNAASDFAAAPYEIPLTESEQLIKRAQELIEKNYADPEFKLSGIADTLFVNYSYLSHIFKAKTGKTLFSCLLDERMAHAAYLLKNSNLSVTDIGRKVGYPLSKNFHQAFKKYFNESPKSYKSKNR